MPNCSKNIKERAKNYLENFDNIYDKMPDDEFFELMNEAGFSIPLNSDKNTNSTEKEC